MSAPEAFEGFPQSVSADHNNFFSRKRIIPWFGSGGGPELQGHYRALLEKMLGRTVKVA